METIASETQMEIDLPHVSSQVDSENSSSHSGDSDDPLIFSSGANSDSEYEDHYLLESQKKPSHVHPPTILHWVRMSSLRCHDNEALMHAVSAPNMRFRAVFVIDPWFTNKAINRLRFLLECLHDMDEQLKAYNTRLYVAQGQPLAVLDKLCKEWNVSEITYQIDREIRAYVLENSVEKLAEGSGIKVTKYEGHTLFNINELLLRAGTPITTLREFKKVISMIGSPLTPVDTVGLSPSKPQTPDEDPNAYRIPTLQQLGVTSSEKLYSNKAWIGGESVALKKIMTYCRARKEPCANTADMLFDNAALSPYIRFGCLSVRYLLWKVKDLSRHDPSFETLCRELTSKLLSREFYITVAAQVPNFDSYKNSISLHLPWEDDTELFRLWKEGKTGYPWIDAAMRQLYQEGYIHHLLRESVATFVTRGDLWIHWVKGKDVFEELLLDFEPSVSCGCWMKSSCSAFFTGPIEHYCPMTYGQRIDPTGRYIRTFIPELKNFPDEYIYTPWTAPRYIQEAAGCQIGVDYPHPVVDHTISGTLCCEKLRSVMTMFSNASNCQNQHQLSLLQRSISKTNGQTRMLNYLQKKISHATTALS